jgi:NAD(P)-dependent dehydrogenase (short-subunit alcohol dehydrogenase family)
MGLQTAKELVARGDEVVVWSRNQSEELASLDCAHEEIDVTADLASLDVPEGLSGVAYFPGSINLAPFERIKLAAFQADLEVNLLGAVKVLQKAIPAMARNGGGSVVLVSTVAATTGMAYHASVSAAKAGVEGLARALAAEYAGKNVRVNVIAPSLTDTPMAERLLSSEEKRERSAERHPIRRVGTTGDIASAALYLLGPESGWMTGQVLHIDGGLSVVR